MEEIGCHFKFEKINGSNYHDTDILLSSGRNALRYIIRERNIKKIYLPYFLCESLTDVAKKENVIVCYYHIDENYMPIISDDMKLDQNSYLYLVNYYGLFREQIKRIIEEYKYVIVDDTHDFFDKSSYDADVIYNYRKYFGVADGACLVSRDLKRNPNYSRGQSLEKVIEMIKREETGEFFHYPSFLEADKHFRNEELRYMSSFTESCIHALDYDELLKRRIKNYKVLKELLSKYNKLNLDFKELTFMYPLFVENGSDLRQVLLANNVYSQKLWPNVDFNGSNETEVQLANNMVLLPIDQRYSEDEMEYISRVVVRSLKK